MRRRLSFHRFIYKLTRVTVDNVEVIDGYSCANTHEDDSGYFLSELAIEEFILKHCEDNPGFYIVEAYVYNPTHLYQCSSSVFEYTLDRRGDLICSNDTLNFCPQSTELMADDLIHFKGRDDIKIKKGEIAWFYNGKDKILPCEIGEIPFTTEEAKRYESLDSYDDSFLIYPLPKPDGQDNHDHILSYYVFTEKTFKTIISDDKEKFN